MHQACKQRANRSALLAPAVESHHRSHLLSGVELYPAHNRVTPRGRYPSTVLNLRSKQQHAQQRASIRPQAISDAVAVVAVNTLARDAAATAISLFGGAVLVKFFDFLQYSGLLDKKVSRKWVHILAGPGLLLCWPLYSAAPYARFVAALVPTLNMLSILSTGLTAKEEAQLSPDLAILVEMLCRFVLIGTGAIRDEGTVNAVSREGDRRELLRGPLYYVLVLAAATMAYWRDSPIGITAVAVMSGGDGLADLVGRRFGTKRLPHNRQKSWAGSLAMFLGGWALAVAFIALFQRLELFECTVGAIAGSVGAIAAAAAAFESLPIGHWLDDNLSVPLLAAILGQCLFAKGALLVA